MYYKGPVSSNSKLFFPLKALSQEGIPQIRIVRSNMALLARWIISGVASGFSKWSAACFSESWQLA